MEGAEGSSGDRSRRNTNERQHGRQDVGVQTKLERNFHLRVRGDETEGAGPEETPERIGRSS